MSCACCELASSSSGSRDVPKMAQNRQVLTVLCVVLLGLVLMLLYKVQTLNSQLSQQQPNRSSRLSAFMKLVNLAGKKYRQVL